MSAMGRELSERLYKKDNSPLEDMYDVEEVAFVIKSLDHKLEIQKEYKRKKNKAIGDEMKSLEDKISFFKSLIESTLSKNKEKNLNFPDSCKISIRKNKDGWEIDDEENLKKILIDKKEIDNVAEKIDGYKIDKKKLNTLLDTWEKTEEVPECVSKKKSTPSVVIVYEDQDKDVDIDEEVSVDEEKENMEIPHKNFGNLDI